MQLGDAGFVDRQRQGLAVLRQIEALDVPLEVRRERGQLLRGDVDVAEPLELAVLVGGHVHAAAVGREHAGAVGDVLRRVRSSGRLLAVRRIDQPQRALGNRRELHDQQAAVVRRPVDRLPAAAGHLHHQLVGLRIRRIHDVEIAVGAVAAGRTVGQPIALGAPDGAAVLRAAAVGEQRDAAVGHVVAIELRELVAADVLAEHEVAALDRLERRPGDRLVEEGQLRARTARQLDVMDLRGIPEARRDQHLPSRRVPVGEVRGARLGIPPHVVRERRRDRRNAVDDEVLGGRDETLFCACGEARPAVTNDRTSRRRAWRMGDLRMELRSQPMIRRASTIFHSGRSRNARPSLTGCDSRA